MTAKLLKLAEDNNCWFRMWLYEEYHSVTGIDYKFKLIWGVNSDGKIRAVAFKDVNISFTGTDLLTCNICEM